MITASRPRCAGAIVALVVLMGRPTAVQAQRKVEGNASRDSVTVTAGPEYQAGAFHRWLLGGAYRDLWTLPIRVPVLDPRSFAGGLTPEKVGGGKQTRSLRLRSANGDAWVFRSVDKERAALPQGLRGVGPAEQIGKDQTSSSHPAANLVADPILTAVGVLHERPMMFVMADDAILGNFRKEFAGRLGILSRYPEEVRPDAAGFLNAVEILDSDSLLLRMNRRAVDRIDAPQFLAARLVDMLLNNYDRHPDNWKWARMQPGGPWEPIDRDEDKVLLSNNGFLPTLLGAASLTLISFDSTYPGVAHLAYNSLDLDRRVLSGVSRSTFDSVAREVTRHVTNDVLDQAMRTMPREYWPSNGPIVAKLRMRRDSIPAIATRFYLFLAGVVDVHGTEAADRATIVRREDGSVQVELRAGDGATYFSRRFDPEETRSIHVYLHGGDDRALVTGNVKESISLRVIGGNGNNTIVDSSHVSGRGHLANLYDVGPIDEVRYGDDTSFSHRPLVRYAGELQIPGKFMGGKSAPIAGLSINHDMGFMPRLGMTWRRYGFRDVPYASQLSIDARYSLKNSGLAVTVAGDQRREESRLHFTELARMSELELLNFHGFGNNSAAAPGTTVGISAPRTDFFALHQRQWLGQAAVAVSLGAKTELQLGPVVKYSIIDSTPGRFIAAAHPYGSGTFGEAGLALSYAHDGRFPIRHAHHGTILNVNAAYYPALWDVRSAFGALSADGAVYFTLPVLSRPYLGLRAGGKKLFGDFPFQEAAFIGGRNDVRTLDPQRYAGDASLYGTAELRVPVARFTVVLPLNVGLLATEDVGRVFVKGDSPGGWHNAFGAGFWVGFHELTLDIRVMRANEVGRTAVIATRIAIPGGN